MDLLPDGEKRAYDSRKSRFLQAGVPEALADRVVSLANLAAGLEIVRIDESTKVDIVDMGRLYYAVGERFGLDALREIARTMPATTAWQRLAASAVLDDYYLIQGEIVRRALAEPADWLDSWVAHRPDAVARVQEMVADITRSPSPDIAMLTVAARQLRAMV